MTNVESTWVFEVDGRTRTQENIKRDRRLEMGMFINDTFIRDTDTKKALAIATEQAASYTADGTTELVYKLAVRSV